MVSDREFVILKTTIDSSTVAKKYFIAQRSVEVDDKLADKVVRSDLTSAI